MAIRASVYIATSLDGFISRQDGSIDWLNEANGSIPPGEDCGYKAFADSVDVLVMGRNTFDLVRTFEPWPYGEKRVVVMSSKAVDIPQGWSATVSHSSEEPESLLRRLESEGCKHAYIDGGITIQRFLRAGLIDEITITLIPVLLGAGRPLFAALEKDVKLKLVKTKAYEFGFVQVTYSTR
jgi:dihydrofolate reductase